VTTKETLLVRPTVILRSIPEQDALGAVVVTVDGDKALVVFCNYQAARQYQEQGGRHKAEDGCRPLEVNKEAIAALVEAHDAKLITLWRSGSAVTSKLICFWRRTFLRSLSQPGNSD